MATPYYEKSTGIVVIEWYESKEGSSSSTRHHFEARPIKLQLHPKDPSRIIRIYFDGKMPSWVNRYVKEKEHPFECKEIFQNGMVGWWIANWRRFDAGKPFNAPTIKGCINALIDLIPAVVEDYREHLRARMDTIAANLAIDPTFYESFGLYYRPEEITGEGGAMVADENLILVRMSDESDQDFENRIRSHGQLDRLVFELTTPLPVPVTEEEESESAGPEEEFNLTFDEEGDFSLEFEDEGEFALNHEADSLLGFSLDFADDESAAPLAFDEESNEVCRTHSDAVESTDPIEHQFPSEEEEAVFEGEEHTLSAVELKSEGDVSELAAPGQVCDPESGSDGTIEKEESDDTLQLHVIDNSNRRHCAVAGQLSFF